MMGPRSKPGLNRAEPDTLTEEGDPHIHVHQAVRIEEGRLVIEHRVDPTGHPEGQPSVSNSLDLDPSLLGDLGKAAMDSIDDDRDARETAEGFEMIRFVRMMKGLLQNLATLKQGREEDERFSAHVKTIRRPLGIAQALLDARHPAMVSHALDHLKEAIEKTKAAMEGSPESPLDPLVEKMEKGFRGLDKLRLKIRKGEDDEEDLDGPGDEEKEAISARFLKLKQIILKKGLSTHPDFDDLLDQMDAVEASIDQYNTDYQTEDVDTIEYHLIAAKALLDTCEEVVVPDALSHLIKAGDAVVFPPDPPNRPPILDTISKVYARLGFIYMKKLAEEGETLTISIDPDKEDFDTTYWTDENGDPAELVYFSIMAGSKYRIAVNGYFDDPSIIDTLKKFQSELEEIFEVCLYPDQEISKQLIELGLTVPRD